MTVYSLGVLLPQIWTSPFFHVQFCCFLTCTQISQKAGRVIWYSHLFKNFPQFVVIHTVIGFSVVNEAEVDIFLEFLCLFYDPVDAGNFISGSSAFSESGLNICKFLVHVLLKPHLENFEHYFTSLWDECNCAVVWAFFGIAFLWGWNENWCFPILRQLLSFPSLLAHWMPLLGFEIAQLEFHHLHSFVPSNFSKAQQLHTPGCLALVEWPHHHGYMGH